MRPYSFIVYLLKKILIGISTLFVVVTITFFLMRLIPGHIYNGDIALSPAVIKNIELKYHLNEPLASQYFEMLKNTAKLDFGTSMAYEGRSVNDIISTHFPISALLGLISIILSALFGIITGTALVKIKGVKKIFIITAISIGMALPNFVAAILLQYFFSVQIPIFPVLSGKHVLGLVLPLIALSLYPTAFIARSIYYNLKDILRKDYILAAKARGVPENKILYVHALKNALLPLISYLGPLLAAFLMGSFAIETIFSIPGLGRYFIISIAVRDYTTIMGVTIFYSMILIFINISIDVLYRIIDPRIKGDF